MTETLFIDRDRNDSAPRRADERHYEFLDRVNGEYWNQIRVVLNTWTASFPSQHRGDLVARLRDKDEAQFRGALLELYLHESFRGQGWAVEVHPETEGSRRPDFLVSRGFERAYVEATNVVDGSDRERGAQRRQDSLKAALDEIADPNFYLWLDIRETGPEELKKRPLVRRVSEWLGGLDPDGVTEAIERFDLDAGGQLEISESGWMIQLRPVPKGREWRGTRGGPSVAIYGGTDISIIDKETPIRSALRKKARTYGDLDASLIIAVGIDSFAGRDDDTMLATLFGSSTVVRASDGTTSEGRAPDGFWFAGDRWCHTNVSAVLALPELHEWSLASVVPTLFHHPEPNRAARSLPNWRQFVPLETDFEELVPTQPAWRVLDLPEGWPIGETFPGLLRR